MTGGKSPEYFEENNGKEMAVSVGMKAGIEPANQTYEVCILTVILLR